MTRKSPASWLHRSLKRALPNTQIEASKRTRAGRAESPNGPQLVHERPRALGTLLSTTLACSLGACITSPHDVSEYDVRSTQKWEGFAKSPGETVRLQALNQCTKQWKNLATPRAATRATDVNGTDIFYFETDVRALTSGSDCTLVSPFGCFDRDLFSRGSLKARGLLSDSNKLATFTQAGYDALIEDLNAGADVLNAGANHGGLELNMPVAGPKTSTWSFDVSRLRVHMESESSGDEPMITVIPFRIRIQGFDVSEPVIGWNQVIQRLGKDKARGSILNVNNANGRVHYTDVERVTMGQFLNGKPLDVLGAIVLGVENDSTDRAVLRDAINRHIREFKSSLKGDLTKLVLSGGMTMAGGQNKNSCPSANPGGAMPKNFFDAIAVAAKNISRISKKYGIVEGLENLVEGAVGEDDDFMGAQIHIWPALLQTSPPIGVKPNPLHQVPDEWATGCDDIHLKPLSSQYISLNSTELSFANFDWRAEATLSDWTEEVWFNRPATCPERGIDPYNAFNDGGGQPQLLTPTAYLRSAR